MKGKFVFLGDGIMGGRCESADYIHQASFFLFFVFCFGGTNTVNSKTSGMDIFNCVGRDKSLYVTRSHKRDLKSLEPTRATQSKK